MMLPNKARLTLWVLLLLTALPLVLLADDGASVTAAKNSFGIIDTLRNMGGTIVTALANIYFLGLTLIWALLNWAVLTLYQIIGSYLIPIWDFSNFGAFLQGGEADWGSLGSLKQVVGVPVFVSSMLWATIPFVVAFSLVLMVGLVTQAITSSAMKGEDGLSAYGGLFTAVGLMIAFPLLYSVPIILGNQLGRDFYSSTLGPNGVITVKEAEHDRELGRGSGMGAFGRTLLGNSFFSANDAEVQTRDPQTLAKLPSSPNGIEHVDDLGEILTMAMSSVRSGDWRALIDVSQVTATGIQPGPAPIGSILPPAESSAATSVLADQANRYVSSAGSAMETLASRTVQIVLSLMGIIGLFGLLILKGSQVLAIVLNFFLAPIACAMYVSPSTRHIFWNWVKAHIAVCMWSFLWALLLVVVHVVSLASEGLQGMGDPMPGSLVRFAPIGAFLMPFILFAAIKKFNSVAQLADSMSMTGAMATQVAGSVSSGFRDTWNAGVPTGVSDIAGNKAPSWLSSGGSAFKEGSSKMLAKVAGGLDAFAPGAGRAASAAIAAGGKVMAAAGSGMQKVQASQNMVNKFNPLAMRTGMKAAQNPDKQKTAMKPPAPRADAGGSGSGNVKGKA